MLNLFARLEWVYFGEYLDIQRLGFYLSKYLSILLSFSSLHMNKQEIHIWIRRFTLSTFSTFWSQWYIFEWPKVIELCCLWIYLYFVVSPSNINSLSSITHFLNAPWRIIIVLISLKRNQFMCVVFVDTLGWDAIGRIHALFDAQDVVFGIDTLIDYDYSFGKNQ